MIPDHVMKERAVVHSAVGELIGRWANLELQLAMLFATALKLTPTNASLLLVHIKTFSLTMDLVDAAVKINLADRPRQRWNSLVGYIRELSGDRNYVAHTPAVFHLKNPNEAENWGAAEVKVGPPTLGHLAQTGRLEPIGLEELAQLIEDIQEALHLTLDFQNDLKQPASNEKFATEIVRRRPPRKQRQESAPRTPKGPPRSSRK